MRSSKSEHRAPPYGEQEIQEEAAPVEQYVRPKDAAISCSHFWACVLMIVGVAEIVIGVTLFVEWEGVGAGWVGVASIAAGIAGLCVKNAKPAGGSGTALFLIFTVVTFVASVLSVMLGDGITYLVVTQTEGNCFDASDCSDSSCAERDCVCWEPDGTLVCDAGAESNLRYCLRFPGDCADIGESEKLLLASSIVLVVIAVISTFSFAAAVATCCCCKRYMVVDRNNCPS